MGFRVKIIDYGLSHSDTISEIKNPKSLNYNIANEAGIYPYYSDIYDQHYIINDVSCRYRLNTISPLIDSVLKKIVDSKYIGKHKKNSYINEYWRLGFPFEIKEFIDNLKNDFEFDDNIILIKSPYNIYKIPRYIQVALYKIINTKLKYDSENKLIIDDILNYAICTVISYFSHTDINDLSESILNILSNPFENNKNVILKPFEIIKLFTFFEKVPSDLTLISNTYLLDMNN
jgi:hypothetical protein